MRCFPVWIARGQVETGEETLSGTPSAYTLSLKTHTYRCIRHKWKIYLCNDPRSVTRVCNATLATIHSPMGPDIATFFRWWVVHTGLVIGGGVLESLHRPPQVPHVVASVVTMQ